MPSDCKNPASFPGLTVAFRNTTEFKDMAALIRNAYPHWSEYLVEMAIVTHVQSPRCYRDNHPSGPVVCPYRVGLFDDMVKIEPGLCMLESVAGEEEEEEASRKRKRDE